MNSVTSNILRLKILLIIAKPVYRAKSILLLKVTVLLDQFLTVVLKYVDLI